MPLDPTFWKDHEDDIWGQDEPLADHPNTLPFVYRLFDNGEVHVVLADELKTSPTASAVCRKVKGQSHDTSQKPACRDCWVFLRNVKRHQS